MKTWIDPITQLEWQICIQNGLSWKKAIEYAENQGDGWRLPTVKELETLLDRSVYDPAVRQEVPFQSVLYYWSSITFAYYPSDAWYVDFTAGRVDVVYKKYKNCVRCVRDVKSG